MSSLAPAPQGVFGTARALVALTKPRIIELLLITTLPTMVVAAGEIPLLPERDTPERQ